MVVRVLTSHLDDLGSIFDWLPEFHIIILFYFIISVLHLITFNGVVVTIFMFLFSHCGVKTKNQICENIVVTALAIQVFIPKQNCKATILLVL
jgi:hypothetical protein